MAESDWERLLRTPGRRRFGIVVRHTARHPVLIAGLVGLLVLFHFLKDVVPLLYGLAAPIGGVMIMASMGRYRAPAHDPNPDETDDTVEK
ncbi:MULTISPECIES: hypothetical protein [unclassified Streptomyces]|uniref:hypothetical protein n=1 Tax=unclassified Streptomyces TaxID=2593676 RepID=UPI000DD9406E|nr:MULTISPECIES: hypothetical protein [unclassified Streptomyces]QZZ27238.1 hypothetical protein A7X85_14045 [Streptomyces sp. ST1015]